MPPRKARAPTPLLSQARARHFSAPCAQSIHSHARHPAVAPIMCVLLQASAADVFARADVASIMSVLRLLANADDSAAFRSIATAMRPPLPPAILDLLAVDAARRSARNPPAEVPFAVTITWPSSRGRRHVVAVWPFHLLSRPECMLSSCAWKSVTRRSHAREEGVDTAVT